MPRSILLVLLGLLARAPSGARAHHGDDERDPVAATLARYPELRLRITDRTIEGPATIAAGRYRVIQENMTGEEAHVFIASVPADWTDAEVDAALAADDDSALIDRLVLTGSPDRAGPNGGRSEGIVALAPGRYLVVDPLAAEPRTTRLTAVAGPGATPPAAAPDPAAAVAVEMREMVFELPAAIPAGRQLWKVHNAGALPHEIDVMPVPAGRRPSRR